MRFTVERRGGRLGGTKGGFRVGKPSDQANQLNDQNAADTAVLTSGTDRLVPFPKENSDKSEQQKPSESAQACPSDMADYLAEILTSLEAMAQQHRLEVLRVMLTMAREQAEEDALSSRSP